MFNLYLLKIVIFSFFNCIFNKGTYYKPDIILHLLHTEHAYHPPNNWVWITIVIPTL